MPGISDEVIQEASFKTVPGLGRDPRDCLVPPLADEGAPAEVSVGGDERQDVVEDLVGQGGHKVVVVAAACHVDVDVGPLVSCGRGHSALNLILKI